MKTCGDGDLNVVISLSAVSRSTICQEDEEEDQSNKKEK